MSGNERGWSTLPVNLDSSPILGVKNGYCRSCPIAKARYFMPSPRSLWPRRTP